MVELMVGVTIISLIIMGFAVVLTGVSKGTLFSRLRTQSAQVCYERIDQLKQMPYYKIAVTPTSAPTHPTLGFVYDNSTFAPENVYLAGVSMTRYVRVQYALESNGRIQLLSPTSGDTGLKQLTVTAVWKVGSEEKKSETRGLISSSGQLLALVQGHVTLALTPTVAMGGVVTAVGVVTSRAPIDSNGNFVMALPEGVYTITASKRTFVDKSAVC